MTFEYACIECGSRHPIEPGRYLCGPCAAGQTPDQPLRGQLEVRIAGEVPEDWAALGRLGRNTPWDDSISPGDTRSLLPVPKEFFPRVPVGETPLWIPERIRGDLGLDALFLKDDTSNPTGSLKDRASYLVAAFAAQYGLKDIVVASTGNAGSSMAGIGAAAGLSVRLYLPASAPQAKMVQALQYGANLIKVEGSYDDAFDESLAYVNEHGGLSRNTAHNPLTVEGKKTVSLELFRQFRGGLPDIVYVPTGDGVILSGVYKGFEDLVTLGLAERVPEVVCVQAEGSAGITRALKARKFTQPMPGRTVADSISVEVPRGGLFALGRLERHAGRCITVSDEAIIQAQHYLASMSGLFAEPAAAAAFAGLQADCESGRGPGRKDKTVVLITGNGLKDIPTAMKAVDI